MAAKLKVWIHERENIASPVQVFGPDSDLPEWLLDRIKGKKHLFEDQKDSHSVVLPAPRERDPNAAFKVERESSKSLKADEKPAEDPADDELGDAPKRNGSEIDWREFAVKAKAAGFPVVGELDSMDRNELIQACEDAEVIEAKK